MYSVHLISSRGEGSYLSFKGKSEWKTKRIALKHAYDIWAIIVKGRNLWNAEIVEVENEFGELVHICK
jgi:hypothetical protein